MIDQAAKQFVRLASQSQRASPVRVAREQARTPCCGLCLIRRPVRRWSGNNNGCAGNRQFAAAVPVAAASNGRSTLMFLTPFGILSSSWAVNSLTATAWPVCTDGLPGFRPRSKANGSSIKVSTFVSQFDEPEDPDSVGCQVAMKSPPGPNLHRGSAFISTSALALFLVFYSGAAEHCWRVFLSAL